ncbi:MAG: cation:proton antiporter [Oligoflexales bacterium]|nr:cation:proton antiporter [Oligoflexales bacterium]
MDIFSLSNIYILLGFFIICLAASQMGKWFARIRLPTITGYLFLGILIGPNLLEFIRFDHVGHLEFVDEIALGFIAFCAGSELFWKDIRPQIKTILTITSGILISTFLLCSYAFYAMAEQISFMAGFDSSSKIAVAILAGSILIARSPSSAIAVVKELKAKGPFTQVALGVTVVMDIAVIAIFTLNESVAQILLTGSAIDLSFLMQLSAELLLSIGLGIALSKAIGLSINLNLPGLIKTFVVIGLGYAAFFLSHMIEARYQIHLEGMLGCLVCGFHVANFFQGRREFLKILNQASPVIYVAFFTLTGASLTLGILKKVWFITLILFAVRIIGIIIGASISGKIINDDAKTIKIRWMCFVTQAGVGLGLAKQVSDSFPSWGSGFTTILVSVIIINEIIGSVFFKWALFLAGEAKTSAKKSEKHTIPNAIIFGENNNALTLSRQLCAHNWEVRLIAFGSMDVNFDHDNFTYITADKVDSNALEKVNAHDNDTFVSMLNDEHNHLVANMVSERFPEAHLIISLRKRDNIKNFSDFNASIVDPTTALISLLDHYVRTPSAVSILLGYEDDHDIIDCELKNHYLRGKTLYELNLPNDILILSITRKGKIIDFHSGFRLELHDHLTLIGDISSLEIARYKLSEA